MMEVEKQAVQDFWNARACGEVYAEGADLRERLERQAQTRYRLEPFITDFAGFREGTGRHVLEVGVGMGADHLEWARARPARLVGVDLTSRAIEFTRARLRLNEFEANLQVADAEHLPFADDSFDIVYSWGVLHHSPDTAAAIAEVHRVLRPGGRAAIMIYHNASVVGRLLWLRYGSFGRLSMGEVYSQCLESPGTKAYSREEALRLFRKFGSVDLTIRLSPGDLMLGAAGQRHDGTLLRVARSVWPRRLLQRFAAEHGLFLLVTAYK